MVIGSATIRKLVLEVARDCGGPVHLGGSLSQVEILNVLYGEVLRHAPENPEWSDRDIFLLSKGHAFLGLLATLHLYGYFSRSELGTFQSGAGGFISHPVRDLSRGVEGTTGSLGQGLSYGLGLALAMKKIGNQGRRVFVLMGDSESSEGSVWEAALLAPKLALDNLVAIVDCNGYGNDAEGVVNSADTLLGMFRAAGWSSEIVNGHDEEALSTALSPPMDGLSAPRAIIAATVKGKGFGVMESNNDWHHNRVTDKVFNEAIHEVLETP